MHNRFLGLLCAGLFVAIFSGCGSKLAQVTGLVTLDGTPLTSGTVTFHPLQAGAMAYGVIGEDGRYKIQTGSTAGTLKGDYVATFDANVAAPPPVVNSTEEVVPTSLIPAKYRDKTKSDLKFTLKPGSNVIDLPMVSK